MKIRLAGIHGESMVDGPGIRYTVFVQGCPHECEGCHNLQTHSFNGGAIAYVEDINEDILRMKDGIDGITLSGGEPFTQPIPCAEIAKYAKSLGLNVWCYTGYTFEQLEYRSHTDGACRELMGLIDVLVDGRFMKDKKSMNCLFRGSTNQRLVDVPASLRAEKVVTIEECKLSDT